MIYYQSVMVLCITNFYKKYVLIKLSRCKLANATTDFKNFNPLALSEVLGVSCLDEHFY